MSKRSRSERRQRREQARAGSGVRELPGPPPAEKKPASEPAEAPARAPEPELPKERPNAGPSSVIRRTTVNPAELPPALRAARPPEPGVETVPAAHLLEPQPATAPGSPVNEPPTAPTRREEIPEGKLTRSPKSRTSEPPAPKKKRPVSEAKRSAAPKVREATKPPATPGAPSPRMNETRGIPAAAVAPPQAPPSPPPPAAPPEPSSGTLAGFVNATRRLINKWTGAPPEVRISLPQGDLKLFKISGHIDDRLALQAATWMLFVQAMKADADLTLSIDSTGGSLTAGLSLIDVMLKAKCRIRTHCVRQAQGIASIVLAAGTPGFRTITRSSLITVPGAPGTGDGKTAAVFSPRVITAIAAATRRTNSEVEKDLLKLKAVTPKLAVKHGLADAVAV